MRLCGVLCRVCWCFIPWKSDIQAVPEPGLGRASLNSRPTETPLALLLDPKWTVFSELLAVLMAGDRSQSSGPASSGPGTLVTLPCIPSADLLSTLPGQDASFSPGVCRDWRERLQAKPSIWAVFLSAFVDVCAELWLSWDVLFHTGKALNFPGLEWLCKHTCQSACFCVNWVSGLDFVLSHLL